MNFDEWWDSQMISKKSNLQPIMLLALREIAEKAWNAALTNTISINERFRIIEQNLEGP